MAARRVVIEFLGDDKSASKTAAGVDRSTSKLGERMRKVGKLAAVGLGAAVLAGGAAGKQMFTLGAQLEQMGQKAQTVFGPQVGQVEKWAKANASAMGLTKREATGLAANFGDLLIPMGFTRQQAAKMSTDVVGLSGALSQWSGGTKTAAEVSEILSAAMLGETDGLKSLGISISAADVEAQLLAKGQSKLTGAAKQQAEAQAIQALIMAKSTDAQAAFAKGGSPLLSAQAKIKSAFMETRDTLAVKLVPAFSKLAGFVVEKVIPAIGKAGQWAREHLLPPLRSLGEFIATRVVPIIIDLDKRALSGMRAGFDRVRNAIQENEPQLRKLGEGIAIVAKWIGEKLGPIAQWLAKNVFVGLGFAIGGVIKVISTLVVWIPKIVAAVVNAAKWVKQKWGEITASGRSLVTWFKNLPGNITRALGDTARTLLVKGKNLVVGLARGVFNNVRSLVTWWVQLPGKVAGWLGNTASTLVAKGANLIIGLKRGILNGITGIGTWIKSNLVDPVLRGVTAYFGIVKGASSLFKNFGGQLLNGLKNGITGVISTIGTWIKSNLVDPIINAVKTFFGINSPSKVFEGIGGFMVQGLFKGLGSVNMGKAIGRIFGGMPDALRAVVSKGLVSIGQLPEKALNALGNVQEGVIPKGISEMPKAFQKTLFRGKLMNHRTAAMIQQAEAILGRQFHITQGSFSNSVKASGTTHSGGGAIDTNGPGGWNRAVAALRQVGFAAWHRSPSQGPWGHHIHAIAMGDPTASSSAKRQVQDFLRGGDGLGRLPSGRMGHTPSAYRQGTPWVPDDQMAFLHRGEAVIPAEVNRRRLQGGGTVINFNVNGALDPIAVAKQIQKILLNLKRTNGSLALGLA